MNEYYLGYVFTDAELQVLFSCLGIESTKGLPIKVRDLSEDEEMHIVRTLLRKHVLKWSEQGGYTLEEKFRDAFKSIKESKGSLSLISKNYPVNGYVCFAGEPVTIWEISAYMENRFTLLMFSWEDFRKMLIEEEFIPRISEYCGEFPADFIPRVTSALSAAETSGDYSGMSFVFIVKRTNENSCEYAAAGSEVFGSYIVYIKDSVCNMCTYSRDKLLESIESFIKGGNLL